VPRNLIEEQIALTIQTLQARGLIVAKEQPGEDQTDSGN
jgi:hypothetical protein